MARMRTTLPASLTALTILVSGCALVAKKALDIVLKVGTEVVVQAGADYLEKKLSPGDSKDGAGLIVSYTNVAGDGVGNAYAVKNAKKITMQNVTLQDVKGDIHIVGDGNGIAVTVANGTTGTIKIHSGDGGQDTSAGSAASAASASGDQAATIDGVLGWSGRSRSALFGALDDLGACRDVGGATSALRTVASDRGRQIAALDDLEVSALPGGTTLRSTLLRALSFSLKADQAFVRWGDDQRSGCRDDHNHDDAMSYSRTATATKKQFLTRWNPIARTYGLPELDEPDI